MLKAESILKNIEYESNVDGVLYDRITVQTNNVETLSNMYSDATFTHIFDNYYRMQIDGAINNDFIAQLSLIDSVINIEPVIIVKGGIHAKPNDTYSTSLLNSYVQFDMQDMWYEWERYKLRAGFDLESEPIAIVDNYYDTKNNDVNFILPGWNVLNNNTNVDYRDDSMLASDANHGMGVIGVCCSKLNNVIGVFPSSYKAKAFPICMGNAGQNATNETLAAGIRKAVELGYKVVCSSYGSVGNNSLIRAAAQYAYDNDCILVASSGNDTSSEVRYPGRLNTCICISGLRQNSDGLGTTFIEPQANYGDGVDFCGPYSMMSTSGTTPYGIFGGTSGATPMIAGLISQVRYLNPELKWEQVKQKISDYCVRESFLDTDPRRSTLYGHGIPQFTKTIKSLMDRTSGIYIGV